MRKPFCSKVLINLQMNKKLNFTVMYVYVFIPLKAVVI